jgi:hypothetical protein
MRESPVLAIGLSLNWTSVPGNLCLPVVDSCSAFMCDVVNDYCLKPHHFAADI